MWRKRYGFLFFATNWSLSLGNKIKIEVFLGEDIFKKGGHFKKSSRYIRGRRVLRPAGGGALVLSRGEGPSGGGV